MTLRNARAPLAAGLLFVALALGFAAGARNLGNGWEVLGTVEATLGDMPVTLVSGVKLDTGEATMIETEDARGRMVTIGAMTPGASGEPGLPILTLKLGPIEDGLYPALALDLREAERVLMANEWSETDATLSDFVLLPDGTLSFSFAAELVVMTQSPDGGFVPLHGAVGQTIEGRFDGRLPGR
jgi:hypothetical protein